MPQEWLIFRDWNGVKGGKRGNSSENCLTERKTYVTFLSAIVVLKPPVDVGATLSSGWGGQLLVAQEPNLSRPS